MSESIFTKIINNELPSVKVYEDEIVIAIMDLFPESEGHVLIIPKVFCENVFDIDDKTLAHLVMVSKTIATAAKSALNADGIKIVQFNGAAAGQTVFHYHMHVVPAFADKPFKRHAGAPADVNELQVIADKIVEELA